MTFTFDRERDGGMLLRVSCDGCRRAAASDFLMPLDLCRLLAWNSVNGRTYCVSCQRRRRGTPPLAWRIEQQHDAVSRSIRRVA